MKKRVLHGASLKQTVRFCALVLGVLCNSSSETGVSCAFRTLNSEELALKESAKNSAGRDSGYFRIQNILDSNIGFKCWKMFKVVNTIKKTEWQSSKLRESLEHLRSCALPAHLHAILI